METLSRRLVFAATRRAGSALSAARGESSRRIFAPLPLRLQLLEPRKRPLQLRPNRSGREVSLGLGTGCLHPGPRPGARVERLGRMLRLRVLAQGFLSRFLRCDARCGPGVRPPVTFFVTRAPRPVPHSRCAHPRYLSARRLLTLFAKERGIAVLSGRICYSWDTEL